MAVNLYAHQSGRTAHNLTEGIRIVIFEMRLNTKSSEQRRSEQAGAGSGTNEREVVQVNLNSARTRPFINHDINAIILHGRVEILLHDRAQAVDLVDEQHIVFLQRGEQTGQVTGFVEHWAGGHLKAHSKLVGYDIGQGRFAQSRRAKKQGMVEALMAQLSCFYEDTQVIHDLRLAAEIVESKWAQRLINLVRR